MSGSLSNRGCYVNRYGKALLPGPGMKADATHFFCLDCGKKHPILVEYQVVEGAFKDRKIIRTLCFKCFTKRAARSV